MVLHFQASSFSARVEAEMRAEFNSLWPINAFVEIPGDEEQACGFVHQTALVKKR